MSFIKTLTWQKDHYPSYKYDLKYESLTAHAMPTPRKILKICWTHVNTGVRRPE